MVAIYSPEEQKIIADIVSRELYSAVTRKKLAIKDFSGKGLDDNSGCFVTLKTSGDLRGCIGCFTTEQPLYKTLAEYTRAAALEDPRFAGNRLLENELEQVDIDVSVLTPLQACNNPEGIILGRDGIYIVKGMHRGCFLPQVATETGWSVEEFWGNCSAMKAGLDYNAWRNDSDIELFTFTAEIIEFKYFLNV